MATYKRVEGDYNIVTVNNSDNVIIDTHTVEVRGNLDVVGNLTYINVSELNVKDPFIVLNSSNTSSYAANAGVLTHIDSTTFAGIRYNSDLGRWQISGNTSATGETGVWDTLATANSAVLAAGSDTQVQFNQGGVFGASSNLTFDYTANILQVDGDFLATNTISVGNHQIFANVSPDPDTVIDSAVLYHKPVGSGGTGLYVKTDTVDDELVSRAKAIVFGIIF